MLLSILTQIVDHPDDVTVDEEQHEQGSVLIIHANSQDMGKIIGKGGRIIRAVRDLVKLMATKKGIYADVELAEEAKSQ